MRVISRELRLASSSCQDECCQLKMLYMWLPFLALAAKSTFFLPDSRFPQIVSLSGSETWLTQQRNQHCIFKTQTCLS